MVHCGSAPIETFWPGQQHDLRRPGVVRGMNAKGQFLRWASPAWSEGLGFHELRHRGPAVVHEKIGTSTHRRSRGIVPPISYVITRPQSKQGTCGGRPASEGRDEARETRETARKRRRVDSLKRGGGDAEREREEEGESTENAEGGGRVWALGIW